MIDWLIDCEREREKDVWEERQSEAERWGKKEKIQRQTERYEEDRERGREEGKRVRCPRLYFNFF